MLHFQKQLNVNIDTHDFNFILPPNDVDELDCAITVAEVNAILQNCKDNKAPGADRIPVEFLKYASPQFIEKMTAAFNHIRHFVSQCDGESLREHTARAH